ncbi:MAG TPA: RnfABCDGE type electron transport complex subunit C [Phycisphaerae bacterium]|nr:RnfABCDGE type electron transport complex subunit C [Phycisphaerae bacterium]
MYLPTYHSVAITEPIRDLPLPNRLVVPLLQHEGGAADPIVKVGQLVAAGKVIGKASGSGAVCVHAPAAGRVMRISHVVTSYYVDAPAIEIEIKETGADHPSWRETGHPLPNDINGWADAAERAGIVSGRPGPVGLGTQLRQATNHGPSDVIINGLPSEPLVISPSELLRRHTDVVAGIVASLRKSLKASQAWIAVDRGDRDLLNRCRQTVRGKNIRVSALRNKYPQAAPVLLTWAVTGKEIPIGRQPEDIGCLVLEVEALLALAEAVRSGRPMIDRVVNVTGPAVARPGLYRIPVGTRMADVLRHVGLSRTVVQVIDGGPLTGRSLETLDAVVTKRTSAILVLSHEHDHVPTPGPCIRCGFCQDSCPVSLDPLALLNAAECGDDAATRALHPGACLACGLCSYVCPAELPLARAATRLKQRAIHMEKIGPIVRAEQV